MNAFLGQTDWPLVSGWLLERAFHLVLIGALAWGILRLLRHVIPRIMAAATAIDGQPPEEVQRRIDTLSHVMQATARWVVWIAAGFMVLSELGLDMAPVLAGVGIVGIAVGFGAQRLVQDIIAGLFILSENQYGKGDIVTLAGISGQVEEVNLRRTVLRDMDGTVHSIPNSQITIASNRTRQWSRINLDVTVAYKENIDRAIALIDRVGRELAQDEHFGPLIIEPAQVLRVESISGSGIVLKILGVTRPNQQWEVAGELRRRLKGTFDAEGVQMP